MHSIVVGYEQAFTCNNKSRELYYYYSTKDKEAIRFVIFYDSQYKFDKIQESGYDDDPHLVIVSVETCFSGLID